MAEKFYRVLEKGNQMVENYTMVGSGMLNAVSWNSIFE
jgi:hypothetical protein